MLGCQVTSTGPSAALERRLVRAHTYAAERPGLPIVLSGKGKRKEQDSQSATTEAHIMSDYWRRAWPQPPTRLILESHSRTTRENALFVSKICLEHGWRHLALVSCSFHLPRAQRLFEAQRLIVTPIASADPPTSVWKQMRRQLREWGARGLEPWEKLR